VNGHASSAARTEAAPAMVMTNTRLVSRIPASKLESSSPEYVSSIEDAQDSNGSRSISARASYGAD
jgi:hypothetical protein